MKLDTWTASMYPCRHQSQTFGALEMTLDINQHWPDLFTPAFTMLFISLLCLANFAAAMPTFGSWSLINMFTSGNNQFPLRIVPDFKDARHVEKNLYQGTVWDIISSDSTYGLNWVTSRTP